MLSVKPYLWVEQHDDALTIGATPPRAMTIRQPPAWLCSLLTYLTEPRSPAEILAWETKRGLEDGETAPAIRQLTDAGVLSAPIDQTSRYARHLLYYDLMQYREPPEAVQERLSAATIALVGVGGIGTNLAQILAAAGVGRLVLSDADTVELSNLTRQWLFTERDAGRRKIDVAAERLSAVNSECEIVALPLAASEELFDQPIYGDVDFAVLSADKPPGVHRWVSAASLRHGFAYSTGGYVEGYGIIGPLLVPGETACYACYADDEVAAADVDPLNDRLVAPSYGPLNAVVASLAANEAIRFLVGEDVASQGTRLVIDSGDYTLHRQTVARRPDCNACSHVRRREGGE
jgi:molybdopterin/thiamine biosynthesis adenylyltransferase